MKKVQLLSLALIALIACSKTETAPADGCTFKFKGIDYNLKSTGCYATGDEKNLTGANSAGTSQGPIVVLNTGGTGGNFIDFDIDAAVVGTRYSNQIFGAAPIKLATEITISGKTWTFTATLANNLNSSDTGEITGSCVCNSL